MPLIQPVKRATAPAKPTPPTSENGQGRKACGPIIVAPPKTPEWWKLRDSGIGASEAATAIGMDPYSCPLQLYKRKRGEADQFEGNRATVFGTSIESGIPKLWEYDTGKQAQNVGSMPLARHPEHSFMLATPDGQLSEKVGVEFKAMGEWLARQLDDPNVGLANACPQYLIQCQQQMAVMDWEQVILVVFWARTTADWTVREYPIDRSEKLIQRMVDLEGKFWERVLTGNPPDIDIDHPKIGRIIKELFPRVETGKVLELSAESVAAWERYQERRKQIKELETANEQDRASVLLEIGENLGGALPTGKVIKRIAIGPSQVSYERKAHVQVREVSGKNLTVVPAEAEPETEEQERASRYDSLFNAADDLLKGMGFACYDTSRSGSRYYVHLTTDIGRVRVADHAPNKTTAKRMQRDGDLSVRLDELGETEAVQRVLSEFRSEKGL